MASATLIDGFRTPRVDITDTTYQADPAHAPDKADLWTNPEAHDGWVHAHNAIRFEIGEMKRVAEALQSTALGEWQLAAVKAWWRGHATHIHEHHSNEDDIMNPVLRTRIVYPPKLEADHVELVATMDSIEKHVETLQMGNTLAELRALWTRYEELMLPCFAMDPAGRPAFGALYSAAVRHGAAEDDEAMAKTAAARRARESEQPRWEQGADGPADRALLGPSVHHLASTLVPGVQQAIVAIQITKGHANQSSFDGLDPADASIWQIGRASCRERV